jgi:hypothetical protein
MLISRTKEEAALWARAGAKGLRIITADDMGGPPVLFSLFEVYPLREECICNSKISYL